MAAATAAEVVVCGAGVIGVCVSYFLGKRGVKVTLVDKCGVAAAASGKAGGFLALDWCDDTPDVGKLARASFRLHQLLANELHGGDRYGYRCVDTLSLSLLGQGEQTASRRRRQTEALPEWVDGPVSKASRLGDHNTTAQLHPALFTRALFEHCQSSFGARLVRGSVNELCVEPSTGCISGLLIDGSFMAADTVVVALGPWSGTLGLPVLGLKAHSIVLEPPQGAAITPHALFLSYTTADGRRMEPEVYPRPGGEVYVCGMTEEGAELPLDADSVKPSSGGDPISTLTEVASTVSSLLGSARLSIAQACFLPVSSDGMPLIGKLPNVKGGYVATGHSCWGILNAPATGASLAELILDGASKMVDIAAFDPARFSR